MYSSIFAFRLFNGFFLSSYVLLLQRGSLESLDRTHSSIVPQEKLDWSWLEPKDTSNASTEEPRMHHHFTISVLVKNTAERKAKLRPMKISKHGVKNKE